MTNNSDIFNNFRYRNHSLTDAMLNEFYARDFKFEVCLVSSVAEYDNNITHSNSISYEKSAYLHG